VSEHTPTAAAAVAILAVAAGSALAADVFLNTGRDTHTLELDPTRVAVFTETGRFTAPPGTGFLRTDIALVPSSAVERAPTDAYTSPIFRDRMDGPMVIPPVILVRFDEAVTEAQADAVVAPLGTVLERHFANVPNLYRVASSRRDGLAVLADANALAARADTRYAEPDLIFTGSTGSSTNDPRFPDAWGLNNTGQLIFGRPGTPDIDMNALEAWSTTEGDPSIITVVIDTGVDQAHPDIRQIPGQDFTTEPGVNGGPGNFCDNHGTAVAGCISGIVNNTIGAAGIAPGTTIASARPFISQLNCSGSWSTQISSTVSVLAYAESIGARVTNNSNFYGFTSATIEDKYAQTRADGMVHFASAGNSDAPFVSYPASLPSVNAIGALRNDGTKAGFSNFGPNIFVTAPGQDIISTDRLGADGYSSENYTFVSGTSFASPYAAGVAALILSVDPSLTAAEVETILRTTTKDLGAPGFDTTYGHGLVDAAAALAALSAGPCNAADFADPFGQLTFGDVSAFLAAFSSSDPAADLAPPSDVFTFGDVSAFLAAFNAGCP
jgi:subtilisin family serine protease